MSAPIVFFDENSVDIEELVAQDLEQLDAHPLVSPPSESYTEHETSTPSAFVRSNYDNTEPLNQPQREGDARKHFLEQLRHCLCTPACVTGAHFPLAKSFAALNEDDRSNVVRGMLLCLSAPKGKQNHLMEWSASHDQTRKQKRRKVSSQGYQTTRYALRGAWVCHHGFAAVVQVHPRTLQRYANEIGATTEFHLQENARRNGRKRRHSVQTTAALAFLRRYADINALCCPTGRGSDCDSPMQWLSSDTRRDDVYNSYKSRWKEFIEAAAQPSAARIPDYPLTKISFLKVWSNYYPTLRIVKAGSDFCDQCTALMNSAKSTTNVDLRETLLSARREHRCEALSEFTLYRTILKKATSCPDTSPVHLIFDFAEKVLLPHLLRQPGQLHFVTGLRFDIFSIHSSSLNICNVYGLPEGHWPNNKTCNEVASMPNHAIDEHHYPGVVTEHHKRIDLHADNCSGQEKTDSCCGSFCDESACSMKMRLLLAFWLQVTQKIV